MKFEVFVQKQTLSREVSNLLDKNWQNFEQLNTWSSLSIPFNPQQIKTVHKLYNKCI